MPNPIVIDGETFQDAMAENWSRKLKNVPNDRLKMLWRTMAETFAKAIRESQQNPKANTKWSVLQPPTGTGKTQGAMLYAAMLVLENYKSNCSHVVGLNREDPTTVLIVVRLKEQCEEIHEGIRAHIVAMCHKLGIEDDADWKLMDLVGYHHSDHKLTKQELQAKQVLICTHAAYVKAVQSVGPTSDKFKFFTHFSPNEFEVPTQRQLTIVDESLDSVVNASQITLDQLSRVAICTSQITTLNQKFPKELAVLKDVRNILELVSPENTSNQTMYKDLKAKFEKLPPPEELNLVGLLEELKTKKLASMIARKSAGPEDQRAEVKRFEDTFKAVRDCLKQWRYFAGKLNNKSINTSTFLVPEKLIAPVCLDATASTNFLWELLGPDKVDIVPIPKGTRNYERVTLNVALQGGTAGLGKGSMRDRAAGRAKRLVAELNRTIQGEDVLIVSHKLLRGHLVSALMETTEAISEEPPVDDSNRPEFYRLPNGTKVYLGHWGALDGLNKFQDCTHVILFGLPYKDDVWALNMIFGLQGYQPDMLECPDRKRLKELEFQDMTLKVIQAINRVRCRKVVDEQGRCEPTQVWIVLPQGKLETEMILKGVEKDMPGIKQKSWDYDVDDPKLRLHKAKGGVPAAPWGLVLHMESVDRGDLVFSNVTNELGFSTTQRGKLSRRLSKEFKAKDGRLYKALRTINVEYVPMPGKSPILRKSL